MSETEDAKFATSVKVGTIEFELLRQLFERCNIAIRLPEPEKLKDLRIGAYCENGWYVVDAFSHLEDGLLYWSQCARELFLSLE